MNILMHGFPFSICVSRFVILLLGVIFQIDLYAQQPTKLGKVRSPLITEISGITPYGYDKGYYWVHNDSGDGAYMYLIDSIADVKVKVEINGVKAIDIEDVARFEYQGHKFIILADIGNNLRDREVLSLYVIKEPHINELHTSRTLKVDLYKEIKIKYADKRRDAEAVFVDPIDHQVYILSKRDFESTVFSLPLKFTDNTIQILEPLLTLPFTFTAAADISPDGKFIVAKNLTHIYLWERDLSKSIVETLRTDPKNIPYIIEPQGEAICFDLNKRFLYTISERPFGLDSYLYKYEF